MTIHAATLSTIRQQIARIPAGPGRSADEYVEDLRRTLDCMEVAETLESPAEPLRLREGGYYRTRGGVIVGPAWNRNMGYISPYRWGCDHRTYADNGRYQRSRESNLDLIAEAPAPNTILTPIVPVTVDRNTKWCDERGYLSATAVALFTGLNTQIAELRKMIEREVG